MNAQAETKKRQKLGLTLATVGLMCSTVGTLLRKETSLLKYAPAVIGIFFCLYGLLIWLRDPEAKN